MKIAHVVSTFPPQVGGMGQVALEEAQRLAKMGHEVTVFALGYAGTKYHDQDFPFKVVRLWTPFKYGDAGFAPQLFFKLKKFDVTHLHYPFYGSAQCVWWAKKLLAKVILSLTTWMLRPED